MLQVASFKMTDAEGINKLLKEKSLASGMHIMVSNGDLVIPYEDGLPKTNAVKICELGEEKNTLMGQQEILLHSEEVNKGLIADIEDRINVARAEVEKETANQPKKELTAKLNEALDALDQIKTQSMKNQYEVERLSKNIDEIDAKVAELSK